MVSFLGKQVLPDFTCFETKRGIYDSDNAKETKIKKTDSLGLDQIYKVVEPFLFKPSEIKRIRMFKEWVEQYSLISPTRWLANFFEDVSIKT